MVFILFILLSSHFRLSCKSEEGDDWWNRDFSYRKFIEIPFDTSSSSAKYQPINTRIYFDNPCLAYNETNHGIRIVYQYNNEFIELESQIYDLNYSTENIINACSIVFLIPPEANGEEAYYLYYDEGYSFPVTYPDHVQVAENHYRYEPIPGYPFESSYFQITQDGSIVYGVSYAGKFLGLGTAHQITKFSEDTVEVQSPKNAESWASFDFFYQTGENTDDFSSTIQSLQSKKIIIDGNLMVKMSITSGTPRKDIQTTAEYTYYYCPSEHKRIHTHVKHEALKDISVYDSDSLGNICGLQAGLMKSPSISELNFGEMFPYMHVYDESNVIREYTLDTDPEYTPEGIPILTREDDVDLGEKAWTSFDEGETGLSHAIILSSNEGIITGESERKGIQVNAIEGSTPGLLGLETDLITFYFCRNGYESGEPLDLEIPKGFIAEFDAEFITTYNGGYSLIDNESSLFPRLVSMKPKIFEQDYEEENDLGETVDLTAYIHFSWTPPMGTVLSLISGFNFSYISGELYKDNTIISSDIAERIALNIASPSNDEGFLKKLYSYLNIVDWKNISIFKKIVFPNLEPDTYLIKIFKENPFFKNEREFIGFSIINLTEDSKIHMMAKKQALIKNMVLDQNNDPITNATVLLKYKDSIISKASTSDNNGLYELAAPYVVTKTYSLEIYYHGFLLVQDEVKPRFINTLRPLQNSYSTDLYNFDLNIKDAWGLSPSFQLNPRLTSNDMVNKEIITSMKSDSKYLFTSLPPANYQLQIKYKSFIYEEEIAIPEDLTKSVIFPADYSIKLSIYDSRGLPIDQTIITINRDSKEKQIQSNEKSEVKIDLPPGKYEITIEDEDDHLIGKRSIEIIGERSYELMTNATSLLDYIFVLTGILLFAIGVFLFVIKRSANMLIRFVIISLLVLSIMTPWWMLSGESQIESISSTTQLYILPPSLVTITESEEDIWGVRGLDFLPGQLMLSLYFFSIGIVVSCVLLAGIKIIYRKRNVRWSKITVLSASILLIIIIVVFVIGVSTLSKLGVGSFFGSGGYDVNIPGEGTSIIIQAQWGPGIGLYLCVLSVILIFAFYIRYYTSLVNKFEKTFFE